MKIAINALSVTPKVLGGKTYLVQLVKYLIKVDRENEYFIFLSKSNHRLLENISGRNFHKIIFSFLLSNRVLRVLFEQVVIPFFIIRNRIDLLFSPSNIAILFSGTRQVVTVQIPYQYLLKNMGLVRKLYYRIFLHLSMKIADKIIAVSKDIKNALMRDFNIKEDKVVVVYEGIDLEYFNRFSETKKNLKKYPEPFILFVSTLYKYKNPDKLIRAFFKLKLKNKIPHKLILVGNDPDAQINNLTRLASKLGIEDDIIFIGKVPFEEIGQYYKNADVFVYPSRAETFGLPILEAMACETPVIASNRASVPEVVGGAGIIVDPDNIVELADAILKVISDENLKRKLIKKGKKRVKQFSWLKTAQKTLSVFKEVHNAL